VTKLASLLIKTAAKPLSKRIKHEFSRFPLGQRVLVGIGQTSHQVTSRLTIWSSGYKVRSVKPLEEEKAMKTGAEFVGEGFILSVSIASLLWEYNRGKEKDRVKEEKRRALAKAERDALAAQLRALDARLEALENVVKADSESLLHKISGMERYREPAEKKLVPIGVESTEQKVDAAEKEPTIDKIVKTDAKRKSAKATVQTSQDGTQSSEQSESNIKAAGEVTDQPRRRPWWKFW
jgi:hypothetical protein